MYISHTSSRAFSIIEVMVGIFIFTLGLVSIYALLASSLNINEYNKNAIIASHLAREQIELFRNIRDTNYKKLQVWNQQDPNETFNPGITKLFWTGSYYTLTDIDGSLDIRDISSWFQEGEAFLNSPSMEWYQLCLTGSGAYVSCLGFVGTATKTPFYRSLHLTGALDENGNLYPDTFQVTSKVIWYKRGYHEYDIKTLITDWRRI